MAYVVTNDYTRQIDYTSLTEMLDQAAISSGFSAANIQANAEALAKAEVDKYLFFLFDTVTEFAKSNTDTPTPRDPIVLKDYLSIAIYNIAFTANPRDVPEKIYRAYKDALADLAGIRDGMFRISITRKPQSVAGGGRRNEIYSSRKFISRPFDDASILQPETDDNTDLP